MPVPRHVSSSTGGLSAKHLLAALTLVLSCSNCGVNKYLTDDQYLVRKNKVELAKGETVPNWRTYALELYPRLEPQPNGRFFFAFRREGFYLRQAARRDSSRFQRFVSEIIAEEPAFLDTAAVEQSRVRVRAYMLNRGYFDARVTSDIDTTGEHAAKVTYTVFPGRTYRYDTVRYEVDNPAIEALVDSARNLRLVKPGVRVDARDYDAEVLRLVSLMRNNGFADFYANSIAPLDADSAGAAVNATLRILPPVEGGRHRTYTVGDITVFPDVDPLATATTVSIDTTYDGVRIIYEADEMRVLPATLAENIFFRPGELYDQSEIAKSNLLLNQLGVFRLVNIQQVPSADDEHAIDFLVQLTPAARRAFDADPNVSFTDRQAVSGGNLSLIGLQAAGSFSDNNLAGGAEKLTISGDIGVEFNFARLGQANTQRLNTFETGLTAAVELPRFVDYLYAYRGLNKFNTSADPAGKPVRFISDEFYAALHDRAITRVSLAARYVSLLNFFTTNTLSGTFGYTLVNERERYTINHLGLEYFRVVAEPDFQRILELTPFLQRSFGDQVFTAFLFRNVSYSRVDPTGLWRGSWTYLVDFEQSGAELMAVNALTNTLSNAEGAYALGPGLDYARYGRLAISVSQDVPIDLKNSVAWRLASGAARTYGFDQDERDVPYVRQFFGGGANSLRGWPARGVGPGGYRDTTLINTQGGIPFQQADFRLEANLELRGPLTRVASTLINYALFVDAGNIWTLRQDPTRPLSQLSVRERRDESGALLTSPFWRQLAVNAGVGLRWDIQFVLLRFDVGIKLRNPYEIDGTHWPGSFVPDYDNRFNIGIGLNYPF